MAEKVIGFRIRIKGNTELLKTIDSLKLRLKELTKERNATAKVGTAEFDAYNKSITEIEDSLKQLRTEQKQQQKSYEETRTGVATIKELKREIKATTEQYQSLVVQGKANSEEAQTLAVRLRGLNTTLDTAKKATKDLTEKEKEQITAFQQLRNELGNAKKAYKELSLRYGEQSTQAQAQLKIVDELRDKYETLNETVGEHHHNVGNYPNPFPSVISSVVQFNEQTGKASLGVDGLGKTMTVLSKNPVILILGLIVSVLSVLFSAFKKSERGAKIFTQITGVLNAGVSLTVGLVNDLVDGLVAFSGDPIGSIKNLGSAIVDNIINRFKSVMVLLDAARLGFNALINRDLDGLKDASKKASEGLIQLSTGLDAKQQKEFSQAVSDVTENIKEQTAAFAALEEAKKAQTLVNGNLGIAIEKQAQAEQLLAQEADNATLSFKQREEAAKAAQDATQKRANLEISLAKGQLNLINQEIRLRRANGEEITDLLGQQKEAIRGVISAETDLLLTEAENEKRRSELKQDRLERDLDILIDGFDNQKTINEKLINSDKLTLKQRQGLLNETVKLGEQSFKEQINTIKQFTDANIDENELIKESNATVLNEKIRELGLSEIIEGRLLEIVRDRKTALNDLTEAQSSLNEATQGEISQNIALDFDDNKSIEQIKLNEGLQSKEAYNAKLLELEKSRLRQELDLLELSEIEKSERQRELRLLESQEKQAQFELDLSILQENLDKESLARAEKLNVDLQNETLTEVQKQELVEQSKAAQLDSEFRFLEEKAALYQDLGINNIALQKEIADQELAIQLEKEEKVRAELEKTANQQRQLRETQLGLLSTFVDGVEGLLGQDQENRQKYAVALKALAVGEIAINLGRELSAIAVTSAANPANAATFGVAGISQYTIQSAIAIARAGFATVNVLRQQYAEGGFTGDGFYKDSTGHNVAGVVHNDEWVAPKWQVEHPQDGKVIRQLEIRRLNRMRGFNTGGFTSPVNLTPTLPSQLAANKTQQANDLQQRQLELIQEQNEATNNRIDNIKVIVKPSEVVEAVTNSENTTKKAIF